MDLRAEKLTRKTEGSELTLSQLAQRSCYLSKQLEKAGEYEAACAALAEFWPDRSETSKFGGLEQLAQADIKLRAGALLGRKGFAGQAAADQERASNLITESLE